MYVYPFDLNKKETWVCQYSTKQSYSELCYYYSWVISDNAAAVNKYFFIINYKSEDKGGKLLPAKKRKRESFFFESKKTGKVLEAAKGMGSIFEAGPKTKAHIT